MIDGTSMSAPETAHDPVGGVGRGGFWADDDASHHTHGEAES